MIRHYLAITALSILAISFPSAAEGDAEKGEKLFGRCKVCHVLEPGGRKLGPTLYGIMGRKAGSVEGFRYSPALANSGIIWSEETLSGYLENPRGYIPGNRMAFPGLRDAADRENLIAFLKSATAAE